MNKKQAYTDRIGFLKKRNLRNRTEYNSKIDNPFSKVIDRHYGSFKCRLLGNYRNVFGSLSINSIKPFGRHGTIGRKVLRTKEFTAIFYSSGTVELKITRQVLSHKKAVEELRAEFFEAAGKAHAFLEKVYCLTLSNPVQNRPAKYGVEDSAARAVNLEIEGKSRKMDASTRVIAGRIVRRVPHVDNFGAVAAKADARLSEQEHDLISSEIAESQGFKDKKGFDYREAKGKARLQAPELLISIENALFALGEAQREGAENIKFFGENMKAHVVAVQALSKAAKALQPKRSREFKTSFKKSASIRGCS